MKNLIMIVWYLGVICFFLSIPIGWVMNIMQLVGMDSILENTNGVLKLIGIFVFPLGAVLGWVG